MALKAFIDESGKGQPPVFVMAGFIARAEQWAAFNEECMLVLKEHPAIEAFHMTDARWSGVDVKLPKLLDVIRRNVITGIAVLVNQDEYKNAMKGKLRKYLDRPYVSTFFSVIAVSCFWQMQAGLNEPIDFIFDEQNAESDYIQSVWSKAFRTMSDDIRRRVSGRPIHASDLLYPPLQAADILAWYLRRRRAAEMLGEPRDVELARLFLGVKTAVCLTPLETSRRLSKAFLRRTETEVC